MSDYGDDAGEMMFRETVRTIAYMSRSGIMHVNYSRQAKAEKEAERKARQNKRNARDIAASTNVEDINEAIDIIEAAQEQKYKPGDEGNAILEFKTVKWDPEATMMTNALQKNNISYDAYIEDGLARIETAPKAAPFLCALAGTYIERGMIDKDRFPNIEQYPGGSEMLSDMKQRTMRYSLTKVAQGKNAETRGVLSYKFDDPELCQSFQQVMVDEGIECEVWTDRANKSHAAVWQHQFMSRFPNEQAVHEWAENKPEHLRNAIDKVTERKDIITEDARSIEMDKTEELPKRDLIQDPSPAEEAERLKNITQELSREQSLGLDKNLAMSRKNAR